MIKVRDLPRELLEEQYVRLNKSTVQIGRELGVSPGTIRNRLHLYRIARKKRGWHSRVDLTGKKFGKLVALRRFGMSKGAHPLWEVQCECGNIRHVQGSNLTGGHATSCGCILRAVGHQHFNWQGHGEISKFFWGKIGRLATLGNREFNLTIEYGWELFLKQNRQCALSGAPLHFASSIKAYNRGETTASLDRIDSTKGYIKGNVQWLHKCVNKMKSDLPQDIFIEMCIRIGTNPRLVENY